MVQFFVLETIFNSEKRPPKALGRDSLDPEVDGVHWLYVLSERILDKVRVPTGVYYNKQRLVWPLKAVRSQKAILLPKIQRRSSSEQCQGVGFRRFGG